MNEAQEAVVVQQRLADLGPSPTEDEVLQAITGFHEEAVAIALYSMIGSGGGGGGIDFGASENSGTELSIRTTDGDIAFDSASAIALGTDEGSLLHLNNTPGDARIEATADLTLLANTGNAELSSNNGDLSLNADGDASLTAGGALVLYAGTLGFYGTFPGVAQQTGVGVDAASIHAALVNLGLIAA